METPPPPLPPPLPAETKKWVPALGGAVVGAVMALLLPAGDLSDDVKILLAGCLPFAAAFLLIPATRCRIPQGFWISLFSCLFVALAIQGQGLALAWLSLAAAIVYLAFTKPAEPPPRPKGAGRLMLYLIGGGVLSFVLFFGGLAVVSGGLGGFIIYLGGGFVAAWFLTKTGNGGCAAAILLLLGMMLLLFSICGGRRDISERVIEPTLTSPRATRAFTLPPASSRASLPPW
jgi:hypothetical protein